MKLKLALKSTASVAVLCAASMATAAEVEVLHWWTSGGEAAALNVLKEDLEGKGVTWKDMPVAGGSGVEAMTVLRARVTSGNPPTAVQMLGFDIKDWAAEGFLGDLSDVAAAEDWDAVVPPALQEFSKWDGKWIAAPVNVHSTNWMWINKDALDAAGGKAPETWEELITVLDAMKANGIVPLAHGGQAWQDGTVFDSVVLGLGDDFYKKAIIEQDPEALSGEMMVEAFKRMEVLRGYFDDNFSGRDWNLASAMVINGEAGMQAMGDWAKGEFVKAEQVPGEDFVCIRFPGTQGSVLFNSDQFAMFDVAEEQVEAQKMMASAVMNPDFQVAFNLVKGSVPARTDIDDTEFDACGKKGMADLAEAAANGTLQGSMAHGHGASSNIKSAIFDVVTAHLNGEYSAEEAAEELANAVEAAM
ncbi:carbohydrate ABC transporter substrate-binding protein (CUT1 family) [Aliiruegeria haliotis]|uniref:Probable sugar-binding periplasmic protein n=1 Tax=Aliiruegeria haliotis TaxID=1280846 RepID=A0A2T0RUK4_9RHOB|nr:ABC transporter substrate-binding protein [Aliiruegeria haliotis]PRY24886.1 carbohydrate ABC transporter substrate-binding protein (CUT1 family) [Aliiruegeria haliotis]